MPIERNSLIEPILHPGSERCCISSVIVELSLWIPLVKEFAIHCPWVGMQERPLLLLRRAFVQLRRGRPLMGDVLEESPKFPEETMEEHIHIISNEQITHSR